MSMTIPLILVGTWGACTWGQDWCITRINGPNSILLYGCLEACIPVLYVAWTTVSAICKWMIVLERNRN